MIMKNRVLQKAIMLLVAVAMVSLTVNVDAKRTRAKSKTMHKPIEGLAESFFENTPVDIKTVADFQAFRNDIEKRALPYFNARLDKKSTTAEQKTLVVLQRLEKHAEQLGGGSTFDMRMSAYCYRIADTYRTVVTTQRLIANAPSTEAHTAIENEANAWLQLQDALGEYVTSAAFLENFGGTLAYIIAGGNLSGLAEMRHDDVKALASIAYGSPQQVAGMAPIASRSTAIITNMNNCVQSLMLMDEATKDENPEMYNSLINDITSALKSTTVAFPRWIEARQQLLKHFKDSSKFISATSSLVEKIDNLTGPGEGEG